MIDLTAHRAVIGCWHGKGSKPMKTRTMEKPETWKKYVEKIEAQQLAEAETNDFIRISFIIIAFPLILMAIVSVVVDNDYVSTSSRAVETNHCSAINNISTKEDAVRSCCTTTLEKLLLIGGVESNPGPAFICHICGEEMKYARNLKKHISNRHENSLRIPCSFCNLRFQHLKDWQAHMIDQHKPRTARWQLTSSAFDKRALQLTYIYSVSVLEEALGEEMLNSVMRQIRFYKDLHGQIRFTLSFVCLMKKECLDETIREHFYFPSKAVSLVYGSRSVKKQVTSNFKTLLHQVLDMDIDMEGSGWSFESAEAFNINIVKLNGHVMGHAMGRSMGRVKMGRHIKFIPRNERGNKIKTQAKATINVENFQNNKCLLYNIVLSLWGDEISGSKKNPDNLDMFLDRIDHSAINFEDGVEEVDIEVIEKNNLNLNIAINVWRYRSSTHIEPFYISKNLKTGRRECNMLLIEEQDNSHLIHINSKADLFRASLGSSQQRSMTFFCPCCNLFRSDSSDKLIKHYKQCRQPKYFNKTFVPSSNQFLPDGNLIPPPSSYKSSPPYLRGYFDFETLHKSAQEENCSQCSAIMSKVGITIDVELVCTHTNKKQSFTCSELPAIAFYLLIVDKFGNIVFEHYYCGLDAAKKFISVLVEKEKHFRQLISSNIEMLWSEEDQKLFDASKSCHECGKRFSGSETDYHNPSFVKKVRDHDHNTGLFRAALCSPCNLQKRNLPFIPLYCHNFRGFDAHLIIRAMDSKTKFNTISQNEERLITMSIGIYKLIDSIAFMGSSLANLTDLLKEKSPDHFKLTRRWLENQNCNTDSVELLRKGDFPYEYMDSIDRLKEKHLPSKANFSSALKGTEISEDNYQRALFVFNKFGCKSIGDYMKLYCQSDVYLLADVWNNFCEETFDSFQIHPESNYLTLPGFAFDCFKKTIFNKDGTCLTLLDESKKKAYEDIDNGIRGGSVMLNKKVSIDTCLEKILIMNSDEKEKKEYAEILEELKEKAKVESFRMTAGVSPGRCFRCEYNDCFMIVEGSGKCCIHAERCIIALDFNNLYGYAMTKSMPLKDFQDVEEDELKEHQRKFDQILQKPSQSQYDKNSSIGYIFVADLEFSKKAQQKLLSFPLIPQQLVVEEDMLSEQQKKIWNTLFTNKRYTSSMRKKMVNSFFKKEEYTSHYRNLAFYCKLGVKVTLRRGYKFYQSKFISSYVKFCSAKRKSAKSASDKKLWKDMANIIFGKLIEDVKKRVDIRYYNNFNALDACLKTHVDSMPKIISEDITQVNVKKREVKLDKPIHVGFTVLELR
jgi:hypothetical protein